VDGAVAVLAFGGITLTRVLSREIALAVSVREIGVMAALVSHNAQDAQMLLVLLDTDGYPLLDANGQYLISDVISKVVAPGTPDTPAVLNTLDSFVLDTSTLG
jgi:hypothetical protein